MNINPIYLQEVSREYYDKILNKSQPHKDAAKLTRKWAKENPNATSYKREAKFMQFVDLMHKHHDELKNKLYGRNKTDTESKIRSDYMNPSMMMKRHALDPKIGKKHRDDMFKKFRADRINHRKKMNDKTMMFFDALDDMTNPKI